MISVEQIRALEGRVEKALAYIASLKTENADLKRKLELAEGELRRSAQRAAELEAAAEAFRRDQARIEEGIIHALEKLDAFEDLVIRAADVREVSRAPAARSDEAPVHASMSAAALADGPQPNAAAQVALGAAAPVAMATSLPASRSADELSPEELEAATAPESSATPVENELDIF